MQVKIEKGELIVRCKIADPPAPSSSGKTLVIATTHGGLQTEAVVNGQAVIINLSAYIRKPKS